MINIPRMFTFTAIALLGAGQLFAAMHESARNVQSLKPYYSDVDADLSRYNKVYLDPLKVADARVVPPPWYDGDAKGPRKWALTDEDMEFLRSSYREAMISEIQEKGGYAVVEEIADDVIILDMEIVTLMPYARRGEQVQVRGFGELLAQATLRDGMTSNLLAIMEGSQDVGSEYQQNTRLNTENNLKALFQVWAERMRAAMDDSRK